GIRKQRLPLLLAFAIDPFEGRSRQEYFAAHLDATWHRLLEDQGNRADDPDIGGNVFAANAVAPRRAAHEAALLIRQGDAQAIDFQLGDIDDARLAQPRGFAHAIVKALQLLVVI